MSYKSFIDAELVLIKSGMWRKDAVTTDSHGRPRPSKHAVGVNRINRFNAPYIMAKCLASPIKSDVPATLQIAIHGRCTLWSDHELLLVFNMHIPSILSRLRLTSIFYFNEP